MNTGIKVGLHNEFLIVVEDIKTKERREYKAQNIILDQMWNRLCGFSSYFVNIHYGTGTTEFNNPARKTLNTFLGTRTATEEFKNAAYPTSQWRKRIVINPDEEIGEIITEVGIAYGATENYLVTHAPIQDSSGKPISLGPKLGTEIITIYADVFITLYQPDVGMFFVNNNLRSYLLGGSMSAHRANISFFGTDSYNNTYNWDMFSKVGDETVNTDTRTVKSYTRFQANEYNRDIRFVDWDNIGVRVEMPRPGVFSGEERVGVVLGTGDDNKKVFTIPNRGVREVEVYVDEIKSTDWDFDSLGRIVFDTAPGNGLSVTADYFCPFVPKDSNHVFDVTFTLTYGASAPPAVVSPPDYSDLPGLLTPVAGTTTLGFFGEVAHGSLINGESLCDLIGATEGTLQNSTEPWLKYARRGKILYVAKKPIRYSISWNDINSWGAVYGEAIIMIGGVRYAVRLLSTTEWEDLIYPVHVDYGQWEQYTNADLYIGGSYNGRYTWTSTPSSSYRIVRGYGDVSDSNFSSPSNTSDSRGFRPVLEPLLLVTTINPD